MALPVNPVATGTGAALTPTAGADRAVCAWAVSETNATIVLSDVTYGGVSADFIFQDSLSGNQLNCFIGVWYESSIAARVSDAFSWTWSSGTGVPRWSGQWEDVDQTAMTAGDVIILSDTNSNIAPAVLTNPANAISVLDGGVIVDFTAGGTAGATWTWVNYTQQFSDGGGGFSRAVATRAIATGGQYALESDASAANRGGSYWYTV